VTAPAGWTSGRASALRLALCLLVLAGAGWTIGELLDGVADPVDQAVQAFFVGHRGAWGTVLMRAVTDLGSSAMLIAVAVGAGLLWHRRTGTWRPLSLLVGAYVGAWVLQRTIKLLTQVPRPPATDAVGVFSGYAFPSGHATDAAAVYGMLAVLLAAAFPRRSAKAALWTVAVVVVGLVGLSRIYLGGHWLIDVLAGLAVGAAWSSSLWRSSTARRFGERRRRAPGGRPSQRPLPRERPALMLHSPRPGYLAGAWPQVRLTAVAVMAAARSEAMNAATPPTSARDVSRFSWVLRSIQATSSERVMPFPVP
jgi:membrane-associated phospholipid phosphatase